MTKPILVRDAVGFDLTKVAEQKDLVLDQMAKTGSAFKVTALATSSGKLINMRVYPGRYMPETVKLWTDKKHGGSSAYCKPVLLHHDHHGEPIGRVRKGTYVRTRSGKAWELDYKRPDDESGKGSGHQILELDITDGAAVEKILDERYLTLSMSGILGGLKCSICQKDWAGWDWCEHRPGKTYKLENSKGMEQEYLCYLITGPVDYKEISFVDIPADQGATVLSWERVENALKGDESEIVLDGFFNGGEAGLHVVNDSVQFMDLGSVRNGSEEMTKQQADGSKKVLIEMPGIQPGELDDTVSNGTTEPEAPLSHGEPAQDPAPASDASAEEQVSTPEPALTDEEFALANVARSLKDAGMFLDAAPEGSGARVFDGFVKDAEAGGKSHYHRVVAQVLEDGTLVGRTYATVGEGVEDHDHVIESPFSADDRGEASGTTRSAIPARGKYSAGEDHSHEFQLSPVTGQPQDALAALMDRLDAVQEAGTLSADRVNALASRSFCGPNKIFPAPDALHLDAVRYLLPVAKMGPEQMATVLAAAEKRGKALGIAPKLRDAVEPKPEETAPAQTDETKTLTNLLVEKTAECARLSTALDLANATLSERDQRIETLSKALSDELGKRATDLARSVVVLRRAARKADAKEIRELEAFDALVAEYAVRTPESLTDSIRDLLAETVPGTKDSKRLIEEKAPIQAKTRRAKDPTNDRAKKPAVVEDSEGTVADLAEDLKRD